ncbi:MAG: Grx4 family monothiol glutaredoxin [Myxococcales bacterium]|nr:Grx4 family monothiol glutaredoxin [Myxococcales bacterium]USN51331.1 MAG: Grx4 family monothiol glutaredoxin [Myxococcales bacterium]
MNSEVKTTIDALIKNNSIMLFMKGSKERPQCGFSKQVVEVLSHLVSDFASFDVLSDSTIREAIKEYSDWPTIPQLYVNGEFIGGCDIVLDLLDKGELPEILGLKKAQTVPHIEVSPAAIQAFINAQQEKNDDEAIRISISTDFAHGLSFDQSNSNDFKIEVNGVTLIIDPYSATRADKLKIDFITEKLDSGFSFENPNEPPHVKEMSVEELKQVQLENKTFHLIDVRPQAERDLAHITFARPLENISEEEIKTLDKNSMIVFHCHHGGRSRAQAEKWRNLGFKNLYNLTGGIDAWARKIDAKVPTYA